MLAHLAERAAAMGARFIIGEYIETKKNVPCRDFYPEHGFTQDEAAGADGTALYRLDLTKAMPQSPQWLLLEGEHDELASSAVPA